MSSIDFDKSKLNVNVNVRVFLTCNNSISSLYKSKYKYKEKYVGFRPSSKTNLLLHNGTFFFCLSILVVILLFKDRPSSKNCVHFIYNTYVCVIDRKCNGLMMDLNWNSTEIEIDETPAPEENRCERSSKAEWKTE